MALENGLYFKEKYYKGRSKFFIDTGSLHCKTYSKNEPLWRYRNEAADIRRIESMAVVKSRSNGQSNDLLFILKGTGSVVDLDDNSTRYCVCKFSNGRMNCVLNGIRDISLTPDSDYIAAHMTSDEKDLTILIDKEGNCFPYISVNGHYFNFEQFGVHDENIIRHDMKVEKDAIKKTLRAFNRFVPNYMSKNGHYYRTSYFGEDDKLKIMHDRETKRKAIEENLRRLNHNKKPVSSSASDISNKIFGVRVTPSARVIAVSSVPPVVKKKGFFRSIDLSNLHGEVNYNSSVKKLSFTSSRLKTMHQKGEKPLE